MQKKTLFVAFIALLFAFTGCKKKESTTQEAPADKFVGSYELAIKYNTYIDGEKVEHGNLSGILNITAIDDTKVNVEGIIEFGGGDAPIYSTTGIVDENGVLYLEPNEYTGGTTPLEISYQEIAYDSPLVFKSSMTGTLQGYQMEYEMTNTATKL